MLPLRAGRPQLPVAVLYTRAVLSALLVDPAGEIRREWLASLVAARLLRVVEVADAFHLFLPAFFIGGRLVFLRGYRIDVDHSWAVGLVLCGFIVFSGEVGDLLAQGVRREMRALLLAG